MNIDTACAEALARVLSLIDTRVGLLRGMLKLRFERAREHLNRSAGQHARYLREGKGRR